ncbi:hypothetical protein ACN42_g11338, partial [Penicillium freii]
MPCPRTIP